jgi:mannose-6-phosphate isomerase-like protein (cupin superfamily)
MNEAGFRARLAAEGYEGPFDYVKGADFVDREHVHDFDVLALVLEGVLTVEKPSGDVTCGAGETVAFPAGEPHLEKPGPEGVRALVGRRPSAR